MKRILFLLCFTSSAAFAQQPNYILFNEMSSFANPALVGLQYKFNTGLSHQNTVSGYQRAPKMTSGFVEYASEKIHGGIGLNTNFSKLGFQSEFQLNLQYAFHVDLGGYNKLSFGTSLGFHKVTPENNAVKQTELNVNAGAAYVSKNFLVGLSATQVTEPTYYYDLYNVQSSRMYHLYSRYNIVLSRKSMIQPSATISSDLDFSRASIAITYSYAAKYWGGLSLVDRNAYGVYAGMRIKERWRLGAAYSVNSTRLSRARTGSVELLLRYGIFNASPNPDFGAIGTPDF